jgi:hypothetical protein
MNDEHTAARVRAAVQHVTDQVHAEPPALDAAYAPPARSRRRPWLTAGIALAAAASVVLGVVLIASRGDDPGSVDRVDSTTSTVAPAVTTTGARWSLQLDGAQLTRSIPVDAPSAGAVAYDANPSAMSGIAVRTHQESPLAIRSSWPDVHPVTVRGVEATGYFDPVRSLVVVPVEPALTVDAIGVAEADLIELIDQLVLVDGAWAAGRPAGPRSTAVHELEYALEGGGLVILREFTARGGLVGLLLDLGLAPDASSSFSLPGWTTLGADWFATVSAADPERALFVEFSPGSQDRRAQVLGAIVESPEQREPAGSNVPTTVPSGPVLRTIATVLESPQHGPQLCLGAIADSLPPQCGGLPIEGWDWAAVTADSASGTTWGEYYVEGHFDGTTFTVAGPPRHPTDADRMLFPYWSPALVSPCTDLAPVAAGTDEQLAAVLELAPTLGDFAGLWLDTTVAPQIVNVAFTANRPAHEADLRAVWPGPLCVIERPGLTQAQADSIVTSILTSPDALLGASFDVTTGRIVVETVVADEEVQSDLVRLYGDVFDFRPRLLSVGA